MALARRRPFGLYRWLANAPAPLVLSVGFRLAARTSGDAADPSGPHEWFGPPYHSGGLALRSSNAGSAGGVWMGRQNRLIS